MGAATGYNLPGAFSMMRMFNVYEPLHVMQSSTPMLVQ